MPAVSSELRPKAITNRRIADTDGPDYYPTPEWATWALCVHEGIWGDIWEPAAGDGAMLNVLRREQKKQSPLQICYGSDLYPRGDAAIATVDFLGDITRDDPHSPWSRSWDMIVTNPPYHSAEDFVLRALQICNSRVAMLLRLQFLEGAKRHKTLFDYNPPSRVWVFSERVTFYPAGETPKGSGTTAYAWFIWDLRCPRRVDDAELRWIRPGTKARYVSSEKGERDE